MAEKAKIQYVGQFYIHGAAAPKLEPRRILRLPRTTLPLFRPNRKEVRSLEPVAFVSILLGVALAFTMLFGMIQVQEDWKEYHQMNDHLTNLRAENAELSRQFWAVYDMEEVRRKAAGLGMIDAKDAKHVQVVITPANHEELPEPSWQEKALDFWEGLWE